jgi:alkylhydroperoxidase/carboxymuconolactone decarboxylase family protein YurZ
MKHNNFSHKLIALLLAVLLVLGTAPAALAAENAASTPWIVYQGRTAVDKWLYQNHSTTYTPIDLFHNFKGVMPGDTLTQDVVVKNSSANSIKLYLQVLPHGANNALSENVAEKTTLDKMTKFLNQLTLQVAAGEGDAQKVLFDIPEGHLGTFSDSAELGILHSGKAANLQVKLDVPITMSNAFAKEIGEVDFVFTIEEIPSGGGRRNDGNQIPLLRDKIAVGNNDLIFPLRHAEQYGAADGGGQLPELFPDQG